MKQLFYYMILCVGLLMLSVGPAQAQLLLGEGGRPADPAAVLELGGNTRGFLLPRMTTAQRNAINMGSFPRGLMIYNTDNNCVEYWNDSKWVSKCDCVAPPSAVVNDLQCQNAVVSTPFIAGVRATGFIRVPYKGGNGGAYRTIRVNSTGVLGLTATAPADAVATGDDSLLLTVTGTPDRSGTAIFSISLGGRSCNVNVTVNNSTNPGTNGTGDVSGWACTGALSGTLTAGTAVSGVTKVITATVTKVGTYNISTTVNGVTFSAMGTFTGTGNQNITLTASGIPAAAGTFTYRLNTVPYCEFTVTVVNGTSPSTNGTGEVSNWLCGTSLSGTLTAGTSANGTVKVVIASVTRVGTYSINTGFVNGVTFVGSGTFTATGGQSVTLTAYGTPTAAGTYTYRLNTAPGCEFTVTVVNGGTGTGVPVSAALPLRLPAFRDLWHHESPTTRAWPGPEPGGNPGGHFSHRSPWLWRPVSMGPAGSDGHQCRSVNIGTTTVQATSDTQVMDYLLWEVRS